jgi:hypothetical protein
MVNGESPGFRLMTMRPVGPVEAVGDVVPLTELEAVRAGEALEPAAVHPTRERTTI